MSFSGGSCSLSFVGLAGNGLTDSSAAALEEAGRTHSVEIDVQWNLAEEVGKSS
jgi:hypothetical protein